MAWLTDRTRKTMTWLDCYGLYREAGINQYMTQEALDGNSEFVLASQSDMEAGADAARASKEAATQYAGDVLMAIGAVVLGAAGGTIAGAVVGALLLAIGAILSFFADLFYVECDKYHCGGYERDSDSKKNNYKRHLKSLVGVQTEDKSSWNLASDCGCSRESHECLFVKYFHDGLIMKGIDWNFVETEPTQSGHVRGAGAIVEKDMGVLNFTCMEHLRTNQTWKPLDKDEKDIDWGGYDFPEMSASDLKNYWEKKYGSTTSAQKAGVRAPWVRPWENDGKSYYYRAWRVQKVLKWMLGYQNLYENLLCRTMECMEETLKYTAGVGEDSAWNQKRRRGSRWYASIIWMMRDIWEAGQQMIKDAPTPQEGWTRFGQIIMDAGTQNDTTTADTIRKMAKGKIFNPSETPWPWFPLFERISFWDMRNILISLKEYFPYVYKSPPAGAMPYGEDNREKSNVMKPIFAPIHEPIIFSIDMKPIPAKLASRSASWPVIGLGVGAAAIGAYALYKALSPSDDEE